MHEILNLKSCFFPDIEGRCQYSPFSASLNYALNQLDVACRDTLFPYYLAFHVFTGRNTEVIKSWKRFIWKGGKQHSLLESFDPLGHDAILVEGWKSRGKGFSRRERDSVQIKIESPLYAYLEFVLDYTNPVATVADIDSVWCYLPTSGNKNGYGHFSAGNTHHANLSFCQRHFIRDDEGNRMITMDIRKFRKVHLTKELFDASKKHDSMEAVIADLKDNARHKSFDTTLSNYINNKKTNQILDAGIVVLQNKFLEESRSFNGTFCDVTDSEPREGTPMLTNRCDDPIWFDSSGSEHNCSDYDFCLGCERSRVYPENLASICARILQYQKKKIISSDADWEEKYMVKDLRAQDVISKWRNRVQVENAWIIAKSGSVKLPSLR